MKKLNLFVLVLALIAAFGLTACGGGGPGSPTDPGPPMATQCSDGLDNDNDGLVDMADPGCSAPSDDDESDDPNDGEPIESTIEFSSVQPPCGSSASSFLGADFTMDYTNTSNKGALVSVELYATDGTLVGGGSNHRELPPGSGTAIADADGNAGSTSTRVVIELQKRVVPREILARTEISCTHTWE